MKRNTRVIYSFDLFDTCFIRACGAPRNVFDLLAYRVLGANSDESARTDFGTGFWGAQCPCLVSGRLNNAGGYLRLL